MANGNCKECKRALVLNEENFCACCELTRKNRDENSLDVNCGICKVIVEEDSEGLFCDVCNSWFHNDCNKTPLDYELYALLNEAPKNVKWFCDKCIWETEKWIKFVNKKQCQALIHNKIIDEERPAISEIKIDIDNEDFENRDLENEKIYDSVHIEEYVPPGIKKQFIRIKEKEKQKKSTESFVYGEIGTISKNIEKENILNLLVISSEKLSNINDGILSVKKTKYIRSKCKVCPKSFIHLEDCIAHILRDHEGVQRPYKCSVCKMVWETKASRNNHILAVHSSEKRFSCNFCGSRLKTKSTLQTHMRTHSDENLKQPKHHLNICTENGYATRHGSLPQSSEAQQSKDNKFPAIEENKHVTKENKGSQWLLHSFPEDANESPGGAFGEPYESDDAESVGDNESKGSDDDYMEDGAKSDLSSDDEGSESNTNPLKKYQCRHCDKFFIKNSTLIKHMRTHTSFASFKCNICEMVLASNHSLKLHIKRHTGEKLFKCSHCDKTFIDSSSLKMHLKIHSDEKPHQCSYCDRAFKLKAVLKVHLATHTGEKPHKCDKCEKAFIRYSKLMKHKRVHTGEKPHLCNQCGKAFTDNRYLAKHMKIHSGEKPYQCNHCDKSFVQSNQLKSHMRIHTGEKPYLCSYCGKGYSHNCQLKAHMRTHTDEKTLLLSHCDKNF
ncbi:unnamed protein product [Meganyctiphanes norvegica]|uniref:Uncharacterized protein n=1 Tax=Meganyctiphanes norvegica TaxID=48144 RepID=A0AAV2QNJ4_MEGNR